VSGDRDLVGEAVRQLGSLGKRNERHLARLPVEAREELERFRAWLVDEDGYPASTAQPYKSQCAKALCHVMDGGEIDDLPAVTQAAVAALARFREATS
jgi:hypothetical protein